MDKLYLNSTAITKDTHMKKDTRLINFHVQKDLKDQFDAACEILGISKTKVLIESIEGFLIANENDISKRAKRQIELKEAASKTLRFKEFLNECSNRFDDEHPLGFHSSDHP